MTKNDDEEGGRRSPSVVEAMMTGAKAQLDHHAELGCTNLDPTFNFM